MSSISQRSEKYSDFPKPSRKAERQKVNKRNSENKDIFQECFIIGIATLLGVALELERRLNKTFEEKKFQRFTILTICDDRLQQECVTLFNQWKNSQTYLENQNKIQSRDDTKSLQNIALTVLMNYFIENNQKIKTSAIQKHSNKFFQKEKIVRFNNMNENEILNIGERICKYLIDTMPIIENKTRLQNSIVLTSIPDDIAVDIDLVLNEMNQTQEIPSQEIIQATPQFQQMQPVQPVQQMQDMVQMNQIQPINLNNQIIQNNGQMNFQEYQQICNHLFWQFQWLQNQINQLNGNQMLQQQQYQNLVYVPVINNGQQDVQYNLNDNQNVEMNQTDNNGFLYQNDQ